MLSGSTHSATRKLSQIISQEETACQSLLETVYEERRAVRALAVTEFHTINCRRLAILEVLQTLANERDLLILQLSQTYKLSQSASTLHGVIDALSDNDAGSLREQYDRFIATAKMVREQVKQNVVLIENIRGFVDGALSAGTALLPSRDTYNSTGHAPSALTQPALIRQQG